MEKFFITKAPFVSDNTMKILTALFVPNNKGKRCSKNIRETYFNSEHTIDFCVVKVFMVLLETKKKFPKLTKRP